MTDSITAAQIDAALGGAPVLTSDVRITQPAQMIETFHQQGDGGDYGPAMVRAATAGVPFIFGPRSYLVNGQLAKGLAYWMFGTRGATVLQAYRRRRRRVALLRYRRDRGGHRLRCRREALDHLRRRHHPGRDTRAFPPLHHHEQSRPVRPAGLRPLHHRPKRSHDHPRLHHHRQQHPQQHLCRHPRQPGAGTHHPELQRARQRLAPGAGDLGDRVRQRHHGCRQHADQHPRQSVLARRAWRRARRQRHAGQHQRAAVDRSRHDRQHGVGRRRLCLEAFRRGHEGRAQHRDLLGTQIRQ